MSATQEFTNENYLVYVETFPECKVKMKTIVKPGESKKIFNETFKKVAKDISVPGFRKGKAPEQLILKHFNSQIEKEWHSDLLNTAFNNSIKLCNLYPHDKKINNANIEVISKDQESIFHFEYETYPNIPDINIDELTFEKHTPEEVNEAKINQVIEDVRYQFANWDKIENRGVQIGDFVDVDVENLDRPGEFLCKDTRLEVQEGKIGKWLLDLLIGMNVGDSREALSSQEEGQENPNFVATNCRVTVKEILNSSLPEIDDELAKKAGFDTVDLLKEKISNDLKKMSDIESRNKERESLKKAILEKYNFEVPRSLQDDLYKQVYDIKKTEFENDLKENESLDLEKLHQTVIKDINDTFRWEYLIQKLIRDKKIDVSHQETVSEIMSNQSYYPHLQDEAKAQKIYQHVHLSLLNKKALDSILENRKD